MAAPIAAKVKTYYSVLYEYAIRKTYKDMSHIALRISTEPSHTGELKTPPRRVVSSTALNLNGSAIYP